MRIDRLRFKNLNSLAGEWSVDFQDPAFSVGGIFAITGPTGAGKTTLLDALCLALFGRTPRLKTISTTTNEIMTHGTGECFAEATFTTTRGRFRCHWSQRRARRKAGGRLQPPRHEIVDAGDDTVLETKLRQVARKVAAVTGLDFDRFTRSILLAQGGFAAFLQAGPDERAPILEEITGTAIYSEISMAVHERLRQEGDVLNTLRAQLDGLALPDADGADRLVAEQSTLARRLQVTAAERKGLAEALAWREQLAALAEELEVLDQEADALAQRERAAQPDLARLEWAAKAAPLGADHDRLQSRREALAAQGAAREEQAAQCVQLRSAIEAAKGRCTLTVTQLTEARRARDAAVVTLKTVRALDIQRETAAVQVDKLRSIRRDRWLAVERCEGELADANGRLTDSQVALDTAQAYLDAHAEDGNLTSAMAGIRLLCREHDQQQLALQTSVTTKAEAHRTVSQTGRTVQAAYHAVKRLRATEKTLGDRLREEAARLGEILNGDDLAGHRRRCEGHGEALRLAERTRELTQRRDTIVRQKADAAAAHKALSLAAQAARTDEAACREEKALRAQSVAERTDVLTLLRRVVDLEKERRHLRLGEPCPLCGSCDHPWAEQAPTAPDDAQAALAAAQAALAESENRLQQLIAAASRAAGKLEESALKQRELDAAQVEIEAALDATARQSSDSGGLPTTLADLDQMVAARGHSLNEARDRLATAEALDREMNAHRTELERARAELSVGENRLQSARFENEAATREAVRLDSEHAALADRLQGIGRRLLGELTPFGITRLPAPGAGTLLEDMERRRTEYVRQQAAVDQWRTTITTQTHAAALAEQRLRQAGAALSQAQGQVEDATATLTRLDQERRVLFEDKDPDREEARLAEAVAEAERGREAAVNETADLEQRSAAAAARAQSMTEQAERLTRELTALQSTFSAALVAAGFQDEKALIDARLSAAEMDHLSARKKALAETAANLAARKMDRQRALASVTAEGRTADTRETLIQQIDALERERETLQARAGALAEQLAQIDRLRSRQADLQSQCARQTRRYERWARLHDLIGSADGKKFRVFAQGLTFEQVVAYANQELQKMSDRYIMVRDPERPLALRMADDYQGGVLRTTDNLSGGESFLVSLALALGLANMASRNVRLDSLFLDEGFGTLDEETLEIALESLVGLHQEGKRIGIISHVAALKERIPLQIKVVAGTNGRSRLDGPGCRSGRGT
ncbi:MAG: AAA family ATPase [Desulfosarcinaceae bacterium]|nr:AAA family ATPase [Desulfosarcinaceae bacterium]